MIEGEDLNVLMGRLLEIAAGESRLPEATVRQYREHFAALGFEIDNLQPVAVAEALRKAQLREDSERINRALSPGCVWLGGRDPASHRSEIGRAPPPPLYHCRNQYERCTLTNSDQEVWKEFGITAASCETCRSKSIRPRFITTADLMEDVKRLVAMLPDDITSVVGVARSGMNVATLLAMMLHLPLSALRPEHQDIVPLGHGWRLEEGAPVREGRSLVVDDVVMTGNSFSNISDTVERLLPNALTAAIYVNPAAGCKPDMWVVDLPWPHFLEWNLFNGVMSPVLAVDFDGILCRDCEPEEDDDGVRYAEFLRSATPKFLSRRLTLPLIVTARLERYRELTVAWLQRWNIRCQRLVMGPWGSLRERQIESVIDLKAEEFRRFMRDSARGSPKPPVFVESDPHQAEQIFHRTGGVVICPSIQRCFA